MPELLAELRHFLVETGDLLKTHQLVSQVSHNHPPPRCTPFYSLQSSFITTICSGPLGEGGRAGVISVQMYIPQPLSKKDWGQQLLPSSQHSTFTRCRKMS